MLSQENLCRLKKNTKIKIKIPTTKIKRKILMKKGGKMRSMCEIKKTFLVMVKSDNCKSRFNSNGQKCILTLLKNVKGRKTVLKELNQGLEVYVYYI